MSDWRSYDRIAHRYDRVWSSRFEPVARQIWAMVPMRPGDEHLATVISQQAVARSLAEVAPSETYLSEPGRLETVLTESGFRHVNSDTCHVDLELTVEEFVDDRELSSAGRLALHLLGTAVWTEVRASAIDMLRARFGAHIATGRKP